MFCSTRRLATLPGRLSRPRGAGPRAPQFAAAGAAAAACGLVAQQGTTRCDTPSGSGARIRKTSPLQSEPPEIVGGLQMQGHILEVPLDHKDPSKGTIPIFAREIVSAKKKDAKLPYLFYLQGGPGFPSGRVNGPSGWLARAVQDHRVILLDQRGTGRSAPITGQTLDGLGDQQAADLLINFRADNIVEDCEAFRRALGAKKIRTLGQSYGGFITLSYLSRYPDSLEACFVTGGLAPVGQHIDDVYRATWKRVQERSRRYYEMFPGDRERVRAVVRYLSEHNVQLPSGGILTVDRFLATGIGFGKSGGMEDFHWTLESAFVANGELDYRFLVAIDRDHAWDTNPIYWLMHESIYAEGASQPTKWAAHRTQKEFPALDWKKALANGEDIVFSGEMVFPWMGKTFLELKPMDGVAEKLAAKSDWGPLYDMEKLKNCKVPVLAAAYYEDMYVEWKYSEQVAKLLGPKCKVWLTNEYQHNGLRANGHNILDLLLKMYHGEVAIPS